MTNPTIIEPAIRESISSAKLIGLNQLGILAQALEAIRVANPDNFGTVFRPRSGETADDLHFRSGGVAAAVC